MYDLSGVLVTLKICVVAFWMKTLCSLVGGFWHFRGACCLCDLKDGIRSSLQPCPPPPKKKPSVCWTAMQNGKWDVGCWTLFFVSPLWSVNTLSTLFFAVWCLRLEWQQLPVQLQQLAVKWPSSKYWWMVSSSSHSQQMSGWCLLRAQQPNKRRWQQLPPQVLAAC